MPPSRNSHVRGRRVTSEGRSAGLGICPSWSEPLTFLYTDHLFRGALGDHPVGPWRLGRVPSWPSRGPLASFPAQWAQGPAEQGWRLASCTTARAAGQHHSTAAWELGTGRRATSLCPGALWCEMWIITAARARDRAALGAEARASGLWRASGHSRPPHQVFPPQLLYSGQAPGPPAGHSHCTS